jgi:DNA-binding Xre family transcriptional regulator
MKRDVKTRIRRRVRSRLDELNMTARELAKAIGHGDAWISGILKGDYGIEWKDYDAVCDKLGIEPSELVRYDDSTMRELSPSEMRLLSLVRAWPDGVQRRHLELLEYFVSMIPDTETANFLDRMRQMPSFARRALLQVIDRTLEAGHPDAGSVVGASAEASASRPAPDTPHRGTRSGK